MLTALALQVYALCRYVFFYVLKFFLAHFATVRTPTVCACVFVLSVVVSCVSIVDGHSSLVLNKTENKTAQKTANKNESKNQNENKNENQNSRAYPMLTAFPQQVSVCVLC